MTLRALVRSSGHLSKWKDKMKRFSIISALILACFVSCDKEPGGDTPVEPATLTAPDGVKLASEAGENALSFTWNAVEGATSYTWKLLKGMTLVKDGSVSTTSVNVDGLEASTAYRFAVKSVNSKTASSYSAYFEASTAESSDPGTDPDPETPDVDPVTDVYAQMKIPAGEEDGVARAFPGCEGGGMYTTGGRGGKVIHVTTLEDLSTEGSLRWAVTQDYARTIVFDVAGTITLKSPLIISKPNCTIAGQTAPGDGICIKGRYTQVTANNVIIRFIRFRLGDEDSGIGDSDDCIWGRYLNNIVLDHCSMSWSVDECASFYSNSNFTMQWCIIAESMKNSVHSKSSHGYGGIWGGENASFHHNILAHHDSRNPRFDHPHIYQNHTTPAHRGVIDFRNNVVYDWGSNVSYGGEGYGSGKGTGINMVGNYYRPGTSSTDRKYFMDSYAVYASCSSCGTNIDEGYPLLYMSGNTNSKYSDISSDNASGIYWHNGSGHANYQETASAALAVKGPNGETCYTTTHSSEAAKTAVCNYAGASLSRDAVDKRTANDVLNGKGQIIDCVTAGDGKKSCESLYGFTWPTLKATAEQTSIAATDSDKDGIPDYYEALLGLNAKDASDAAAKTIDKNGRYTNLEMYLHWLVRDIVAAEAEGGQYTAIR